MLLPHGAVVALVDGKNFELYRNAGNEAAPELAALDAPRLDEHNHSTASHHGRAANKDAHLADEDAHANAAVAWLNSQVLGHKIEHLVVIAAPRTLGEMRHHYHKQTERALVMELAKDLTGHQPAEILEALRNKK